LLVFANDGRRKDAHDHRERDPRYEQGNNVISRLAGNDRGRRRCSIKSRWNYILFILRLTRLFPPGYCRALSPASGREE
jgi:hypothetical protein